MNNRDRAYLKVLAALTFTLILILAAGLPAGASGGASPAVTEAPEVRVVIDGVQGTYTDVAIKINDRVLLPFREVLAKLGIPNDDEHIIWNLEEESVTVIDGNNVIRLVVGDRVMSVNGVETEYDVAPFFYHANNRTYVPVRAVSELLDKHIMWEEASTTVYIREKENYAQTLDVLNRLQALDEVTKVQSETEGRINITITTDSLAIPGAGADGALRLTMDMSQLIMADIDNNTYHIKQYIDMDGINIGSEVFMHGDRVFMKIEGPTLEWHDITDQGMYDVGSLLDQINVMESQMNVREPIDVAMGLALVRGSDGTFTLVGEPISITDVNSILNDVSDLLPQGAGSSADIYIDKFHIATTFAADLTPIRATMFTDMNFSVKQETEAGNSITVYFNMAMALNINYTDVGPRFTVPIPEGVAALL